MATTSTSTKVSKKEDASTTKTTSRKSLDKWKFPKIPVNLLYHKKPFRFFPKYVIKDTEKSITLNTSNKFNSYNLIHNDFIKRFAKSKHKFLHLGLVQVAIKPLVRDGLDTPVTVCLRDARQKNFRSSLLALVDSNLSQGPIYFDCFPSFTVELHSRRVLVLSINTSGTPVVLTVRIVCKAMVDLNAGYLKEQPVLGNTTYYRAASGSPATTRWDEVVLNEDMIHPVQELFLCANNNMPTIACTESIIDW